MTVWGRLSNPSSRRQIRQARNPVGAFCLSSENLQKHPVRHAASWLLSAIMQINLVERKTASQEQVIIMTLQSVISLSSKR